MAAISYDTVEILSAFAARRGITIPLLADPSSHIIRRFGVLNEQAAPGTRGHGMAHPGLLLVDARGVVQERLFEERYYHRMTMPTVLGRLGVAKTIAQASASVETLRLIPGAPQSALHPGNRVTLTLDLEPAPGVHLYAPDVTVGYQGLTLVIDPQPHLTVYPPVYPAGGALTLPWTDEPLTGYTGPIRVGVDVALGTRQELTALLEAGSGLTISGTLHVQACDERVCWPPQAIAVRWRFDLIQPDTGRVPEHLQRAPGAP